MIQSITSKRSASYKLKSTVNHGCDRGDHKLAQKVFDDEPNRRLIQCFLEKGINIRGARKIGQGNYSKVYIVEQIQEDQSTRKIAMKVIKEAKVSQDFVTRFLPREIACWKRLRHPNLIELIGHYTVKKHTFLTMEYAPGGDLLTWMQHNGAASDNQASLWTSQIIEGVGYMHYKGIAHRDLKLENCLIDAENRIKVGDFGFTRNVVDELSQTYCGSRSYSAPEILTERAYNPMSSDIWSIGIIIFILTSDRMPFKEDQPIVNIIEIQREKKFSWPRNPPMSRNCRDLIELMLRFHQEERPKNINILLSHPWFKEKSSQLTF